MNSAPVVEVFNMTLRPPRKNSRKRMEGVIHQGSALCGLGFADLLSYAWRFMGSYKKGL